jgi:hypothetical protein
MQNYLFCDDLIGSSVSGDDNEYVIYMDTKGMILIARFSAAGDAGRYFATSGDYVTVVANRGTYTYVLPNRVTEVRL